MRPLSEPTTYRLPWLATRLPLALVILSLGSLAIVPILVQRRITTLRDEIAGIAEPARRYAGRIQLELALEVSAVRGYLLTGETSFLERYRAAAARQDRALAQLLPLARRLGPEVLQHADDLRAGRARWTAPVDSLLTGRITADEFVARIPENQVALEAHAAAAARLDQAIQREVGARIAEIAATGRRGTALTIALVLFALLAAIFVGRLGERTRAVAARFERRAREEEALRRAAAAVVAAVTVEDVIRRIAASAVDAVGADGAFVERIDHARDQVDVVAVAGAVTPDVGTRFPYRGSLAEEALTRRAPVFIPVVAADERPLAGDFGRTCGPCSAMLVPLIAARRPIGVLVLLRRPARPRFDADDLARADAFADLAALAFYKVYLLEQSERRRVALEQATESRARLIRGFSHDVKNPLGAAGGYAQLLEEGIMNGLTPRQQESVRKIRRSIGFALRLIDDLLDLARAEAGQLVTERQPIDVSAAATEAADEHRGSAASKRIDLNVQLPEKVPPISSDAGRVRQIIGNLLSNAIRYTPEGGRVRVRVDTHEGAATPGPGRWAAVHVADTGPGIPKERQESIFREFTRIEPRTGRGAGIGLAISRTLARALGGDLTVTSEPGRGATFTLWLPLAPPRERPEPITRAAAD